MDKSNSIESDLSEAVKSDLSRREFLKKAGLGAAGAAALWMAPVMTTINPQPAYAAGTVAATATPGPQPTVTPPTTAKLYWTRGSNDPGGIFRSDLDGSNVETVLAFFGPPNRAILGVALDKTGGKMYWSEPNVDRIRRANLDGTGIEEIVTGLNDPRELELDLTAGKVYWVDRGLGKVQRANFDGTAVEDVVAGLSGPIGLGFDGANVYWAERDSRRVARAPIGGGPIEVLYTSPTGSQNPTSVSVDVAGAKVYWAERNSLAVGSDEIFRADLNGANREVLVSYIGNPIGLDVDPVNGKLYWMDNALQKIHRANLDGTGIEDVVTGFSAGAGVTIVL